MDWRRKLFEFGFGGSGQGQFAERLGRRGIEQAENDFFAGDGRIGGNADVVLDAEFVVRNPAVLRQRFLIRLQPRQKFDPAKNAFGHVGGQFASGSNDAVEPEADLGGLAAHLQVDVAGAGAFGLSNQLLQNFRRGSFSPTVHLCRF